MKVEILGKKFKKFKKFKNNGRGRFSVKLGVVRNF